MITDKIKLSDYGFDILQIESTAACNMACSFCPYPLKDDKQTKMPFENIKQIINQIDINDRNFKYITFSQFNEPLLDNRIFEITEYAQKYGLKVLMITNGLLLNKEKNVEGILKLKPDIKISLQVLDSNKHKDARGLNLDLENYVKTIVNFCKQMKNYPNKITIDIGCNFNDKKINFFLKKILGLQIGEPSMPKDMEATIDNLSKYINYFYEISDKEYKEPLSSLMKKDNIKEIFNKNYLFQDGFNIFKNIVIKIKPFHYGRKIKDFKPTNDNFSCDSKILGVQADGNVVPCCLAYDDSISLGKTYETSLKSILKNNLFIKNLRNKNGEKHITCKKCFGEPTARGATIRKMFNALPEKFKESSLVNFFR